MWPKGEAEAEVDEDEDSNRTEDGDEDEDEDDGDKETMKIRRRERQEATAWLRLLSFLLLSGFRRVSASARKQKRQDRSKWPASRSEEVEEAKGADSQEDRGSRMRIRIRRCLLFKRCSLYIYIGLAIYTTRLSPRSAIILPLLRHRPPDGLALA